MKRLEGKVAFVTGGAGGLGKSIALAMAAEGARVAIADINLETLHETASLSGEQRILAYQCDVSDRTAAQETINDFVSHSDGLDILVNNAVYFCYGPLVEMEESVISRMLDVGLKGTYWCTQAATPHLISRKGGSIINMSSVAVSMAIPNSSIYTSIKGALDAFTRQQALELGQFGIRVNALAPGPVRTPGASSVIDEDGWESRREKTILKILPEPIDVANPAIYLASDESRCVTGITLNIDSGITVTGP